MQDIATLGVVNLRYCGFIAIVKVQGKEDKNMGPPVQSIELLDQPEGGANALNINRFAYLLFHEIIHIKKIRSPCYIKCDPDFIAPTY